MKDPISVLIIAAIVAFLTWYVMYSIGENKACSEKGGTRIQGRCLAVKEIK